MELLLPTLDRMPDENWYQVSAPDRKSVADWYLEDCKRYPDVFKEVKSHTFLKMWRVYFNDVVKLRKYHRFAKCKVCITLRAEKNSRHGDLDALVENKRQLNHHYILIKRYRGRAMRNAFKAAIHPTRVISSAQDGTEQLGYGYPKTTTFTHKEDNYRLKTKVMVSMVHNKFLTYYVTPENIHGGPNLAIECLQRMLERYETEIGYLPKVYYFQADDCPRESKNTYQLAYFAWLCERGVFDHVYLSFHPGGHTHNECDQCASRIGLACRNSNIMCKCDLKKLFGESYNPKPKVVWLDEVMDFKTMVNPSGDPQFPKSRGALVKRAKRVSQPLFYKFGRDNDGRAWIRHKNTIEEEYWSTRWYPFHTHPSGLRLENLKGNVHKPLTTERLTAVRATLDKMKWRLSDHQTMCTNQDYDQLSAIANQDRVADPKVWGPFLQETNPQGRPGVAVEAQEQEVAHLASRPTNILGTGKNHNPNRKLAIGRLVSYRCRRSDGRGFNVGRIVRVEVQREQVLVIPYDANYNKLSTAKWRQLVDKESTRVWVHRRDVLTPFELTSSCIMPALARIETISKLAQGYATDQDDSDHEPMMPQDVDEEAYNDVAVPLDDDENSEDDAGAADGGEH
jgi:hypothetical protein